MDPNKLTVEEYAAACGVKLATIYSRLRNKVIKAERLKIGTGKALFIDTAQYPPIGIQSGGRKKLSQHLKDIDQKEHAQL